MFGDWFYHERIRKSVAIFGAMFNNLYITRRGGGGTHTQAKVPIAYAPQRKFLERIQEMYDGEEAERQLAIRLPRMSFEVTNIQYDVARQLPKVNTFKRATETEQDKFYKFYTATPYILTFELNVYGKTHDDCLQVVEQIAPYFTPQYNVTVKPVEGLETIVEDVPVVLQSITFTDDYEGPMEQRRTIIYTVTFDMKIYMYGPKTPSAVITRVDTDLFHMDPVYYFDETVRVETDPRPVSKDSDYTIVDSIVNKNEQGSDITVPDPTEMVGAVLDDLGDIGGMKVINLPDFDDIYEGAMPTYYLLNPTSGLHTLDSDGTLTIIIDDYPFNQDIEYGVDTVYGDPQYNKVTVIATPENFDAIVTEVALDNIATQDSDVTVLITENNYGN